jgi:hypothetical protein
VQRWAGQAAPPPHEAAAIDGSYLRDLLFFANPASQEDVTLVSTACRAVLAPSGPDDATPALCASAAASPAVAILRASRLASLALDALSLHAAALQAEQQAPRAGLAASGVAGPLLEAALLLGSKQSWQGPLGNEGASEAVFAVLNHLQRPLPGLFERLAAVVAVGCPVPADGTEGGCKGVPAAETLCTSLVVHFLAAKGLGRSGEGSQAAALLCVPLLPQRCPSLAPVAARLWTTALQSRRVLPPAALAAWLPPNLGPHGTAGAAAALLGNLIDVAPAALAQQTQNAAAGFIDLASKLLLLLPTEFLPAAERRDGAGWAADDEDEDGGAILAAAVVVAVASTAGVPSRLPYSPQDGPLDARVAAQLARVTQGDVLAAVCAAAFPASNDSDGRALLAPTPPAALIARGAAARQTSAFLAQLMQLPGQSKKVLLNLGLRASLVPRLWFSHLRPAHAAGGGPAWGLPPAAGPAGEDATADPGWMLPLCVFSEAFSAAIVVLGDDGLYRRGLPIPLEELSGGDTPSHGVLAVLKGALWHVLWQEAPPAPGGWPPAAAALRRRAARSLGRLMAQLHERNGRRPFSPPAAFYAENLPPERFHGEVNNGMAAGLDSECPESSRAWGLLAHAPFLVPFVERAKVFQRLVATERADYHAGRGPGGAAALFSGGSRFIRMRRGHVLEDSYDALANAPPEQLRGRVRVSFVSEVGTEEAGVDGGGMFKEFLEQVVKEGFDTGAGLFCATTDRRLYPNPHAAAAVPGGLALLEFLGRMVGKALWEGILLELPLAPFFLKKVRGAPCDVDDLPTLDPQLARSLASLKEYTGGDVSELGLTFSLTDVVLGQPVEVGLIPGGHDVPVTSANAALFAHRVADFRLNEQLRAPAGAFLRGLHALVPRHWVTMFNDGELQELIGGAEGGAPLDLADLQRHVQFAGGYSADHPTIVALWAALGSLTPQQQAAFLRFITSCPRPPLLGFQYLEPPLCVQMAVGDGATERLPTAATCMNLLKLPPYEGGAGELRDKLVYAIEAGAGFELS